jgi:hydrogenase-4 component E
LCRAIAAACICNALAAAHRHARRFARRAGQIVGFLSMENCLFFAAMSATYGMPMVVEFGVALEVLVAMLVLGVFFLQIRERFENLDLHHFESLKEER